MPLSPLHLWYLNNAQALKLSESLHVYSPALRPQVKLQLLFFFLLLFRAAISLKRRQVGSTLQIFFFFFGKACINDTGGEKNNLCTESVAKFTPVVGEMDAELEAMEASVLQKHCFCTVATRNIVATVLNH